MSHMLASHTHTRRVNSAAGVLLPGNEPCSVYLSHVTDVIASCHTSMSHIHTIYHHINSTTGVPLHGNESCHTDQ